MAERPILFSAPMVRALLDGRKTQTRRPARRYLDPTVPDAGWLPSAWAKAKPGDLLWVREAFCNQPVHWHPGSTSLVYRADDRDPSATKSIMEAHGVRWRSSIHMPRWASRLTLEVTEVRVQRLHDISEADKIAEGASPDMPFGTVWRAINGDDSWAANPWVVALNFTVHAMNIDACKAQRSAA